MLTSTDNKANKSKRKRVVLSHEQKSQIVAYMIKNPTISHSNVAQTLSNEFGLEIARRTVSDIYAAKDKWTNKDMKSSKKGNFTEVEDILFHWIINARLANLPLTDEVLKEKARQISVKLSQKKVSISRLAHQI